MDCTQNIPYTRAVTQVTNAPKRFLKHAGIMKRKENKSK
jgi:hypothetical protein